MFKPVARFTTRLQGEDDGLFIGVMMKPGTFKPNTVYEIVDVMGEMIIREVGVAAGAGSDNCISNMMSDGKTLFHWGMDIGAIISRHGKCLFLTAKELKELI